jgi:hypothetical protein
MKQKDCQLLCLNFLNSGKLAREWNAVLQDLRQ